MQAFTVLFHDPATQAPADPPQAFTCFANDADHAEAQWESEHLRAHETHYPARVVWVSATADDDRALQEYWGSHV